MWWVLGAAALLRLPFLYYLPLLDDGNDSYLQPAFELLRSGQYSSFATLHRLPVAPFTYAAFFGVFGEHQRLLVFFQQLIGLAAIGLLADAARREWGRTAAALTAGLLALRLQFPLQGSFLLSETLAHFWFAMAMWTAARNFRDHGKVRMGTLAAGAAAGLAALTRGEFVVVGPLIAAWIVLTGRGAKRAAAYFGVWLLLVGGWSLRNWSLFGYAGLTPDTVTTLTGTALPLVRYDLPSDALTKTILKEQAAKAAVTPGLDPRPTTIDRLQQEHRYSYLEAELALGRVVREAVLTQPVAYLRLTPENFRLYLAPSRWAETAFESPSVRTAVDGGAAGFWRLIERAQALDWLLLLSAALTPLALAAAPRGARATALLAACIWLALWAAVSLTDRIVPRIQSGLYLPLALLGAFSLDALARAALARRRA